MIFELYTDASNQWRWRLRTPNGNIVADSAEAYHNKADCHRGIELVQSSGVADLIEIGPI
jgi:uncharacterized protein YegP (UPF0339 family)